MRVLWTLLVSDEADIIRSNLFYRLNEGIELIVATGTSLNSLAEVKLVEGRTLSRELMALMMRGGVMK
jgi:hypothetical protein